MTRHLVVMVKAARAGRVKTRLGRDIGMTEAAWWFRHQVAALLRRLEDPRWQITLAVAPDNAERSGREWPRHLPKRAQGPGDLGTRMARVFYTMPPGPVLIIGADIPGIARSHIAKGFAALGRSDAVFGPATDGGYWLIGLNRRRALPPRLFRGVRWSTEHALADTLATLPSDARVRFVETLRDVDGAEDLYRLAACR